MKRLAILGASGHGKVVADTAECCGWDKIEFFDDAWPSCSENGNWPVKGTTKELIEQINNFDGIAVAIGNNAVRQEKISLITQMGGRLPSLIHPMAYVSRHAFIGHGTVVFAGAVVNAGAKIASGGILNTGCSVDHDCILDEAVHISPGARLAGGVVVGARTWVGIAACIKQLVCLGADVTVGAGAAVIRSVAEKNTVVGVPADLIESRGGK